MKICFIATGDSIHSYRWINYFAMRGHETHWLSLTPFIDMPKSNIHCYEMPTCSSELVQLLVSYPRTANLLKKIRPDIVHIHSAGRHGLLGILAGVRPNVVTAWGSEILIAGKSILQRQLVKYILRNAALITCDAEHMRGAMINLRIPRNKIRIVYFGTDVKKFYPRKKNRELSEKLRINDDAQVVISLRSLEPIYDVETLISAIPAILIKHPNAVFVIGGKGSQKEKLFSLVRALGIETNVRFVGEIINEQLPEYLNLADVYVSTSLSDAGLSASTAEAMACGLSVVVTDSGENKLWVKDGESGFVVPVKKPKAISGSINMLLSNPSIRSQYGRFNRLKIEGENNYYTEMHKMEKLYESLVEQNDKNKKIP